MTFHRTRSCALSTSHDFSGRISRRICRLVQKIEDIAKRKNCTPAQLAINWTRALSRRPGVPTIIPIPGATTAERVEENSTQIDITDEEMLEIDEILAKFTPAGERYPGAIPVNT